MHSSSFDVFRSDARWPEICSLPPCCTRNSAIPSSPGLIPSSQQEDAACLFRQSYHPFGYLLGTAGGRGKAKCSWRGTRAVKGGRGVVLLLGASVPPNFKSEQQRAQSGPRPRRTYSTEPNLTALRSAVAASCLQSASLYGIAEASTRHCIHTARSRSQGRGKPFRDTHGCRSKALGSIHQSCYHRKDRIEHPMPADREWIHSFSFSARQFLTRRPQAWSLVWPLWKTRPDPYPQTSRRLASAPESLKLWVARGPRMIAEAKVDPHGLTDNVTLLWWPNRDSKSAPSQTLYERASGRLCTRASSHTTLHPSAQACGPTRAFVTVRAAPGTEALPGRR